LLPFLELIEIEEIFDGGSALEYFDDGRFVRVNEQTALQQLFPETVGEIYDQPFDMKTIKVLVSHNENFPIAQILVCIVFDFEAENFSDMLETLVFI
jgi:hypothetical protein